MYSRLVILERIASLKDNVFLSGSRAQCKKAVQDLNWKKVEVRNAMEEKLAIQEMSDDSLVIKENIEEESKVENRYGGPDFIKTSFKYQPSSSCGEVHVNNCSIMGTVQLKKVGREHMKPKWNGDFHSGLNEMVHSIPAGMKGPFHSGRNEIAHSIPAGMK